MERQRPRRGGVVVALWPLTWRRGANAANTTANTAVVAAATTAPSKAVRPQVLLPHLTVESKVDSVRCTSSGAAHRRWPVSTPVCSSPSEGPA